MFIGLVESVEALRVGESLPSFTFFILETFLIVAYSEYFFAKSHTPEVFSNNEIP